MKTDKIGNKFIVRDKVKRRKHYSFTNDYKSFDPKMEYLENLCI